MELATFNFASKIKDYVRRHRHGGMTQGTLEKKIEEIIAECAEHNYRLGSDDGYERGYADGLPESKWSSRL